ncbi:MAG: T9SS type A sorting domain-containing protein [Bacteroidetes bacterium]|nr:T9SS type A sorting domain-containing protein [Bacteroidota bacterium]
MEISKIIIALSILSTGLATTINAQTIWERTFAKPNHDYKDYSITTAADGSGDVLLAGTLWDKGSDTYRAHLIRIDDGSAAVVFEQTYELGGNTWAMSIAPFQSTAGTGYAITGFVEQGGFRRTVVATLDEGGSILQARLFEQGGDNGMGLHIKATPDAANEGFVLVGMVHEPTGGFSLQNADKKGFCFKLDQGLNTVWEQYLDVPLGPSYSRDYDVASFVTPTDQGYFITGGKNMFTIFGQQRQGILAVMLDPSGNPLWDASYFTGNFADNGASAYYDQAAQQVYVLTNISVSHHLGISVFDANSGALDNAASFEASSSNFDLDKYGYCMVKAPFSDQLLISGRGADGQWANDNGLGQPGFLVSYDLASQQFGVHYSETNSSQAIGNIIVEAPFFLNPLRLFYYPQSLVNIDMQHSAMVSYTGTAADDLSLVVRQFSHLSETQYEFCADSSTLVLDTLMPVGATPEDSLVYTSLSSTVQMPAWNATAESTSTDTLCFVGSDTFSCESNLVQNGNFEQGMPTTSDEDISNAANWGGIWSNAGSGFSSADYYSDQTPLPTALQAPLPASQGKFAGFWSRIQGGDVFREGILNELSSTIMPNTGVYELSFKTACLFTPASPASLSIFVADGGINGGAAVTSGTSPLNTALFADSWEFAVHPLTPNCDNNFQTVTFTLDTGDPLFPASGVNALFFTRTDGVMPGAYVAIDDVCLRLACCQEKEVFADAVQNGFTLTTNGNTVTVDNDLLTRCSEVRIDWGDGQTDLLPAGDLSVSHTYAMGAAYNISIFVSETAEDGTVCNEDRFMTTITSAANPQLVSGLSVYPVPVQQRLNVEWSQAGAVQQIVLRGANGALLQRMAIPHTATATSIDMTGLPAGLYFLQLVTPEGGLLARKLVKK